MKSIISLVVFIRYYVYLYIDSIAIGFVCVFPEWFTFGMGFNNPKIIASIGSTEAVVSHDQLSKWAHDFHLE